jgi:hypothetical protein
VMGDTGLTTKPSTTSATAKATLVRIEQTSTRVTNTR